MSIVYIMHIIRINRFLHVGYTDERLIKVRLHIIYATVAQPVYSLQSFYGEIDSVCY